MWCRLVYPKFANKFRSNVRIHPKSQHSFRISEYLAFFVKVTTMLMFFYIPINIHPSEQRMSHHRTPIQVLVYDLLFILTCMTSIIHATDRPVVGVFTRLNSETGEHYIAASYVKWLESAGARTLPIHSDQTSEDQLREIFQQINGVLFPGGGDGTGLEVAKMLWEMAKQANESGDHFPIWGTCLGFEWMLQLASSSQSESVVQNGFAADDISLILELTEYGVRDSNMFADSDIKDICASEPVAYNHHQRGIEPSALQSDEGLMTMFEITSVSYDTNGRVFVSSMEAKEIGLYPYYAVQWHPEKNNFEYGTLDGTDIPYVKGIRHTTDSIRVSQHLANLFVTETRRSQHEYYDAKRFPLVWNYTMKSGHEFEQYFVVSESRQQMNLRGKENVYISSKA